MPVSRSRSRQHLMTFLVIAFAWAWAFWWPVALEQRGVITLPDILRAVLLDGAPAAWGPLIAAVVVAGKRSGLGGVGSLFKQMLRFRFPLQWYLVALLLIPAIVGAATAIAYLSGDTPPISEGLSNPISLPIAFLWIFFFGGPLQEEAGWRATMTEGFPRRTGALWASLLTGLAWGIWHLPLFYMPRSEIYYNQPIWGLLLSTMMLSVLLTWVYNNTNRSLLAAMLMHTSWNWSNFAFTGLSTDTGGLAFLVMMAMTVIGVVVFYGPSRFVR